MPRKKTGQALEWRKKMKVWAGRVRGYPDGTPRGAWMSLGTDDKSVAQQRYDQWVATGEPPKEAKDETFEEAAERIVDSMPIDTPARAKKAHDRRTRLRSYVFSSIGQIEAWRIDTSHISGVLDRLPALGKRKGTIAYVRTDISQVLRKLMREGARLDNPARALELPEEAVEDGRLRTVPYDEDFVRFQEVRGFEAELDIAVLLCRGVAGHRTSDLLAARHEHIDYERGLMKVRRPKTDTEGKLVTTRRIKSYELVEHVIPPTLLAPLRAWWQKQGCPATGALFVAQKSARPGLVRRKDGSTYERKGSVLGAERSHKGASFAPALRRAFWEAGIYRPLPGFDPAHPNKRLCAFQTDTEDSRRLEFHSVRRAFVTALKAAGTPAADVLALAGHTQMATSSRYDTARRVQAPAAALPRREHGFVAPAPPAGHPLATPPGTHSNVPSALPAEDLRAALLAQMASLQALLSGAQSVPKRGNDPFSGSYPMVSGSGIEDKSLESLVEPSGIEPETYALRKQKPAPAGSQLPVMTEPGPAGTTPADPPMTHFLGHSIAEAAEAGDWALVEELTAIAKRRAAAPPANVRSLDDARKRRR